MKIKIKKLNDNAVIPTSGSQDAAGYDLYACLPAGGTIIAPGTTLRVPTGLALEIPAGYFGAIFARSGMATKMGLRPANCVGVIDPDYRGEVAVVLYNDDNTAQVIRPGDRIAQLVIVPYLTVDFTEVDVLSDTARGSGGFGSTGLGR